MHRPVSLLSDQDLLALDFLALSPQCLDLFNVFVWGIGETWIQEDFLLFLQDVELAFGDKFESTLAWIQCKSCDSASRSWTFEGP